MYICACALSCGWGQFKTDCSFQSKLILFDFQLTCFSLFFTYPSPPRRLILTTRVLTVPPEEPRIFDAQGKEIAQMAGPFREGYELFLCCQVKGGK